MAEEFRRIARIGHITPFTFFEISYDSFKEYKMLIKKINQLKEKGTFEHDNMTYFNEHHKISRLEKILHKEAIKAIIFLASFIESYIFDYSAIALGQGYTEKHIEKMDTISKLTIVPKLVTGKELNRNRNYWSGLNELIKWRNKIIHNKTKDCIEYFKNAQNYEPKDLHEMFNLEEIFKSIDDLFKELNDIDPKGMHLKRYEIRM